MARGGNVAKKIEIEDDASALLNQSDSSNAANENVATGTDPVLTLENVAAGGVEATLDDNVIKLNFAARTPPTMRAATPSGRNKTPANLPERNTNPSQDTANSGPRTPPTLPTETPGGDTFNEDLEKPLPNNASGPFVQSDAAGEPTPENLNKGDLPSGIVQRANQFNEIKHFQDKTPPTIASNGEQAAATDLERSNAAANTASVSSKESSDDTDELPSILTDVGKKWPVIGTTLSLYNAAPPAAKIKILYSIRQTISLAKITAAIIDGASQWATFWGPLIPVTFGLSLLIAIPVLLIQLFFYAALQETAPSPLARMLARAKDAIGPIIEKLEQKIKLKEQRELLTQNRRRQTLQAQVATSQKQAAEASA